MKPAATFPIACGIALLAGAAAAIAQEKKKEEDKTPRVVMATPLAVAPGGAATVRVRGLRLADATEVRATGATVAIKSKGKADVAQGAMPAEAGDTQVEVELTVPAQSKPGAVPLVVVTPAGETKPYELAVIDAGALAAEKEPNDGFRQGQELAPGKTVSGTVQGGDDVDVYRFEARSGQKFAAEVVAARRGSALDSLLTLYDAAGHTLASNDDTTPAGDGTRSADSVLSFQCPTDGVYYLAVTDANARGGASHPYLLTVKGPQ